MKRIQLIIIVIVAFIFQGCPYERNDDESSGIVKLSNISSELVQINYTFSSEPPGEFVLTEVMKTLEPNAIQNIPYENYDFANGKQLVLFLYKQSTVDAHSWEEIRSEGLYDHRYVLSLSELQATGLHITYDGS